MEINQLYGHNQLCVLPLQKILVQYLYSYIINKIKLLDCAYSDEATPEEINTINQIFPGEKIPVPVGTDEAYNIVTKFIKDRIGNLPSKIY
jgi:hypothetical protein